MSSTKNGDSTPSSILSTFSLTLQHSKEEGRFEKLASLKKLLQRELNKSITIDECDAVLLAGALLLNDTDTVKEQSRLINDINIRLWGNACDPLSKWITQYSILPSVRNMSKFIEGNTPLHFAVLTGNFENIAFLLSKQADPFLKNAHGDKPLELCQEYHRKLHGKKSKRKRHKSLKKRQKKKSKSHKRSKSHSAKRTNPTKNSKNNTYDNDADDENESDYNDTVSSASSTPSITSQTPMHLSSIEFDQLFTNAVKSVPNESDKEGAIPKNTTPKTDKNIQNKKKNTANVSIKHEAHTQNKKKTTQNKKKSVRKSKLKPKTIRKSKPYKSKHKHGHNGKNRNKNKGRINHNRRSKPHNTHKKNNRKNNTAKNLHRTPLKRKQSSKSTLIQHSHSEQQLHAKETHTNNTHIQLQNHKSDSISISSSSTSADMSSSSDSCHTSSFSDSVSSMSTSMSTTDDSDVSSMSTSVTLSDSDTTTDTSVSASETKSINSVQINIDRKNGKIIAKSLSIIRDRNTKESSSEATESSDSVSTEEEELDSSDSVSSGVSSSSDGQTETNNMSLVKVKDDTTAINKLLQETMEQQTENGLKVSLPSQNGEDSNDLHSQLVPIILALSEINIFAESASLARIVKFICTLVFFVALHWLEGNSAAKMIVKVGVSIIYLAAMFGHRINEWKECIDAETVLRKQQWSKQRDKERQKRKDKLQKTLRSPDSKRTVAKKQRKLERDTFYKQDIFDWRSRIRMMINHAESAFIQQKYAMAEVYFSRLLGFLMENETDGIGVFLNERKRSNLKINRRWKGVFDDHYSVPIAKMFSRRAYCLGKIKAGEYPHSAPANMGVYKSVRGHLELAANDLGIAIALREISPLYTTFMKVYNIEGNVGSDGQINAKECEDKLDRLVAMLSAQLCDLVSLAGLCDMKDEFEKAYESMLQADDLIHCLNKFNKDHINGEKCATVGLKLVVRNEESEKILATIQAMQERLSLNKKCAPVRYVLTDMNGNFKLCMTDIIAFKEIESMKLLGKKSVSINAEEVKCSMGERNINELELMSDSELDKLLAYPLRRKVDLNGYQQMIGKGMCSMEVQRRLDAQLKKIRLLRLQAANRQRAVNLKHEREKTRHSKSNDVFSLLSNKRDSKKKDKSKTKNTQNHKSEKMKIKKDKIEKLKANVTENSKEKTNKNDNGNGNGNGTHIIPTEDEVKMQHIPTTNMDKIETENKPKIPQLQLIKSQVISMNSTVSTPLSERGSIGTLSVCSDGTTNTQSSVSVSISTNIASTIMEYGTTFSVIKSDKECNDDCEETKMSMVKDTSTSMTSVTSTTTVDTISNASSIKSNASSHKNNNKNKFVKKNKQRRSQIKLKKLKRKNKNKTAKKKTKKNQSKPSKSENINVSKKNLNSKKYDDTDERLSISSEISKSPSIDTNADNADDDDSLSILSESTSSELSHKHHKHTPQTHKKQHSKNKQKQSPNKLRKYRNIPPRQQNQRRQSKDNGNKHYRKKGNQTQDTHPQVMPSINRTVLKTKKDNENDANDITEEEPREHWLWNVNCDFWPNCRNSRQCPFKHPTDKGHVVRRKRSTPKSGDMVGKPIMCRFGRECSRMDCWFWHPGDDETFIDPTTIPTSPKSKKDNENENIADTNPLLSLSSHSDPSVIATDNSFEIVENSNISEEVIDNAVIITKTPNINPWHKTPKTVDNIAPKMDKQMALLSPNACNNNKILQRHGLAHIRANVNVNPQPLTATITVGAIYHNEFEINDYDLNAMVRAPELPQNRARSQTHPKYVKNRNKKIRSSLNPHASEFNNHNQALPSAPIRPPWHNKPKPFDTTQAPFNTPSATYDPHSQFQNGAGFSPHNATITTQTTISSTITQIKRNRQGLGTRIASLVPPNNNEAYYGNEWNTVDEYKQAPNESNNEWNYDYDRGDESKVVETRQRDSDSDQKQSQRAAQPQPASHRWICQSCSIVNDIGTTNCELCSSVRPMEEDRNKKVKKEKDLMDFNISDIMNDNRVIEDTSSLSFNSLFFGSAYNNNDNINGVRNEIENVKSDGNGMRQKDVSGFKEGEHILYNKQNDSGEIESIAGMIVAIRDIEETPWPIKIEYYSMNEFGKKRTENMWVLPEELLKYTPRAHVHVQAQAPPQFQLYNDDELYDYDDEDED